MPRRLISAVFAVLLVLAVTGCGDRQVTVIGSTAAQSSLPRAHPQAIEPLAGAASRGDRNAHARSLADVKHLLVQLNRAAEAEPLLRDVVAAGDPDGHIPLGNALWDAVAPGRAPRALVAALIGGLLVYGLILRLNPVWASFEMTIRTNMGSEASDWSFPSRFGVTLGHAFVACGAIAGLVCAFAANLIGLTMRRELTLAERLHPPGEGA